MDAIILVNQKGTIFYANPAAEELFGYTQEEFCNLEINGIICKYPNLQLMLDNPEYTANFRGELIHVKKDRTKFTAELTANSFKDVNGNKNIFLTIRDKSDLKNNEKQVQYHSSLLDKLNDAVYELDNNFRITDWNKGAKQMFGYSSEEALGHNAFELLETLYAPGELDKIIKDLKTQAIAKTTIRFKNKLNEDLIVEQKFVRITADSGETERYIVVCGYNTNKSSAENFIQNTLERFYTVLSNIRSSVLLVTENNRVEYLNQAFCDYFYLEEPPADLVGITNKKMIQKIKDTFLNPEEEINHLKKLTQNSKPVVGEEVHMIDGKTFLRDFIPIIIDNKSYGWLWVHFDITERYNADKEREISNEFLKIINKSSSITDLISRSVNFFKNQSKCEAVGIRLNRGLDYPYYETQGFPKNFIQLENKLCLYDNEGKVLCDSEGNPIMECMCGNVICRRFDPSQPFFTNRGSFWTNSTSKLLASTTEADRQARTRNRCNGEGYESVALIPLISSFKTLGLLQLNDKRVDQFSPELIRFWERLSGYLAVALSKFQAEELKQELLEQEQQLSEELQTSNEELKCTSEELRTTNEELQDLTDEYQINNVNLRKILKEYDKLNNTLVALRDSSYAMIHAIDEDFYLDEVCRIIIEDCGYSMVWVGMTKEGSKKVIPVAYSGFEEDYLRTLNITWDDTEHGKGPTGTAIRTGKPSICENMLNDPKFKPWREEALKRGYASSIVLPISHNDKVFGALTIYSEETNPFSEEEIRLLQELADDISFGITSLRLQLAHNKAEKALRKSLLDLKRSNAELEQFAYVTSHDLREPLRMITSFLQLLERRYKDQLDEDANDFIGYAVNGAKRLDAMINDILIYSRVAKKGRSLSNVDMNLVIEKTFLNLKTSIDETNTIITYDPLPTLVVDEQLMVQLFQNLVSNAIKYRSEKNPQIHISAEKIDSQWLFSVEDNGIGISEDHLERIFVIFQRLHTREEYEGTGIGLSIVQKIVHQHGGEIWVKSTLGKGSTFFFTIPAS